MRVDRCLVRNRSLDSPRSPRRFRDTLEVKRVHSNGENGSPYPQNSKVSEMTLRSRGVERTRLGWRRQVVIKLGFGRQAGDMESTRPAGARLARLQHRPRLKRWR